MSIGRIILFVFHIQHALISWAAAGICLLFRIVKDPAWEEGVLLTTRTRGGFVSLAIARFLAFSEAGRTNKSTHRHEHIHRWQSEDLAFGGFWLGLVVAVVLWLSQPLWWLPLVFWELVWLLCPLFPLLQYLTALLRFGVVEGSGSWFGRAAFSAATQAEHERSAYAQTFMSEHRGSWWSIWPPGEAVDDHHCLGSRSASPAEAVAAGEGVASPVRETIC